MAKTEITKAPQTTPSRDMFFALRDEMDRMFERFESGWSRWPTLLRREEAIAVPELDVRESTDSIVIEAELPGVDEKDISVSLANGVLTIKGEKKHEKQEKGENYHLSERSFGSFERAIRLPESIDEGKVEAKFDKGVLRISAAKKPEAIKAERKIEVKKA